MKTVRLDSNVVVEIIPNEATPVAQWYGEEFARLCKEVPDEVDINWEYNPIIGAFYPPGEKPTPVRMAKKEINLI